MSGLKQMMVSILVSSIIVALLLVSSPHVHAAPNSGLEVLGAGALGLAAGSALAGGGGSAGAGALAGGAGGATSTTSTTTTSTSAGGAYGAAGGGVGRLGALAGIQGLVGGALNVAAMPLNTITASLNQLGLPTIATAPLSAVSGLMAQAGTVYGR